MSEFPLNENISLGGVGERSMNGQIFSISPEDKLSEKVDSSSDRV